MRPRANARRLSSIDCPSAARLRLLKFGMSSVSIELSRYTHTPCPESLDGKRESISHSGENGRVKRMLYSQQKNHPPSPYPLPHRAEKIGSVGEREQYTRKLRTRAPCLCEHNVTTSEL